MSLFEKPKEKKPAKPPAKKESKPTIIIRKDKPLPREIKEAIVYVCQKLEIQYQRNGKNIMSKKMKEKYEILMDFVFE